MLLPSLITFNTGSKLSTLGNFASWTLVFGTVILNKVVLIPTTIGIEALATRAFIYTRNLY